MASRPCGGDSARFWPRPDLVLRRIIGLICTRSAGTLCGMYAPVKLNRTWRPHSWSNRSFIARPWTELPDLYWELAQSRPCLRAKIEIIDSVIANGADRLLAGNRTISALNVVSVDAADPPYAAICISAFPADRSTPETIEIRHTSCSGLDEIVVRPAITAVSLFWRSVSAKFGIEPGGHHG